MPESDDKNAALRALEAQEAAYGLWEQRVLGYPVWPLMRLARYRDALLDGRAVIRPDAAMHEQAPATAAAGALLDRIATRLPVLRRQATALAEQVAKQAAKQVGEQVLAALGDSLRSTLGRPPRPAADVWLLTSSTYRRRAQPPNAPQKNTARGYAGGAGHRDAVDPAPCIFAADLEAQLGPRLRLLEVGTTADASLAARPEVLPLDPYIDLLQAVASGAAGAGRVVDDEVARAFAPSPRTELLRRAVYGHGLQRLGDALIARQRPKAVFVLCAYGSLIPLQRAVRAAGIPLIELQHGVIHESHPGYVFGPDVPRDHRPDHLVVFGDHFGRLIERTSPGFDATWSVGGHPWLRRARHRYASSTHRAGQPVVVFGQYDPPVQAQLATLMPTLRARLPASTPLIYKPHPREPMQAMGPRLQNAGVTLADHSDDTYALLADCRAAITVYSTVAIEALAFSCPSFVIRSPYWNDDIRSLVAEGLLTPVADAADIANALRADHTLSAQAERARAAKAESLFGLDAPPTDFEALIAELTARTHNTR